MVKGKWRPGRDMVWALVGVRGCILWPTGHSLVTLFPCLCRLRIGRCTGFLGKSQTYYPKHILVYGRGKAHCSLVMCSSPFLDRLIEGGDGGGLSTALSPGLRSGGLESKFGWGPRPHDRRVVGWSCLCLGYKRGMCFRVPNWDTLVRESPGNPVRLVYTLAS